MNVKEQLCREHLASRLKNTSTVSVLQCTRCILDTKDDPALKFDKNGVCNYCRSYDEEKLSSVKEGKEGEALLAKKIREIKQNGLGKKYDCIIGVSGGVDSSYVAYIAKQNGLRPLCVHFDNGWNSELAVRNIQNIVQKLEFDLYTYVINWEEFRDLQLSYLKASVVDIEVITDHAIEAVIYKLALKHKVKYILGGHNTATEAILPPNWAWRIKDYVNIKAIHKLYGQKELKTYPLFTKSLKQKIANSSIESVNYLNWLPYNKKEIKNFLHKELDWIDYGAKHHESTWTRFFQIYILPKKFGIDKRKAHLSNLICSGQITKEDAVKEAAKPLYDQNQIEQDINYVIKKLEITREEFEEIMKAPVRSHKDFDVEGSLFYYYPLLKPLRPVWEFVKGKFLKTAH